MKKITIQDDDGNTIVLLEFSSESLDIDLIASNCAHELFRQWCFSNSVVIPTKEEVSPFVVREALITIEDLERLVELIDPDLSPREGDLIQRVEDKINSAKAD